MISLTHESKARISAPDQLQPLIPSNDAGASSQSLPASTLGLAWRDRKRAARWAAPSTASSTPRLETLKAVSGALIECKFIFKTRVIASRYLSQLRATAGTSSQELIHQSESKLAARATLALEDVLPQKFTNAMILTRGKPLPWHVKLPGSGSLQDGRSVHLLESVYPPWM